MIYMKTFHQLIKKIKLWWMRERRKFPRYDVEETDKVRAFFSLDGASAYLKDPSAAIEKPHRIINLSKSGMSLFLLDEDDAERFKTHKLLNLEVYIEGQLLSVPCEVTYVIRGLNRVGIKFKNLSDDQLTVISRFLDARFLAHSIKEIPIKKQKTRGQICRWFHGMNNTDLFCWSNSHGQILHCLFIFIDKVVEWTEKDGVRTGSIKRPDYALTYTTLFSHDSIPIYFDNARNLDTIENAKSIIDLANINPQLKKHLSDHLK